MLRVDELLECTGQQTVFQADQTDDTHRFRGQILRAVEPETFIVDPVGRRVDRRISGLERLFSPERPFAVVGTGLLFRSDGLVF